MSCHIRSFRDDDGPHLVEILKRNNQLAFPDVDGLDAMLRVARSDAAVFLVAESNGAPAGMIRAVYDGSRALVHLLSVDPNHQRRGLGSGLVDAAVAELRRRGASTCSVTVRAERALLGAERFFSFAGLLDAPSRRVGQSLISGRTESLTRPPTKVLQLIVFGSLTNPLADRISVAG